MNFLLVLVSGGKLYVGSREFRWVRELLCMSSTNLSQILVGLGEELKGPGFKILHDKFGYH